MAELISHHYVLVAGHQSENFETITKVFEFKQENIG